MCEIDEHKRARLFAQHAPPALFTDISKMAGQSHVAHRAFCAIQGGEVFPPWVAGYGAGFVCKDFSKQHSQRQKLKGTQKPKRGQGQSGTTYHGARDWILKTRPFFSFLENVAEILQNDGEDDDDPSKEAADYKKLKVVNNTIEDDFEKKGMTVVFVLDDPRNKGSLCA